jgi:hypothetical protein
MKLIKYLFICSLITMLAVSCDKGLDPIIEVSPKPDVSDPTLEINYPVEGKPFVSPDEPATITFKLVATDDVELKSVILQLDGTEIGSLTDFKDYRRADVKFDYAMASGDHTLTVTATDLTDKSITKSVNFKKITAPVYIPLDGEVLYFPLDGYYLDLISGNAATPVGTPGFATGKVNDCYAGAADSYMTYPGNIITAGSEFSLSFWYKINADPLRAGILAISPVVDPSATDVRWYGFRLFRENNGANQNIGLNFGDGSAEIWMNPFISVPPDQDWMHIAITITSTKATIYVNGEIPATNGELELTAGGIDWTGCDAMTIGSGQPNFVYWEHFSDLSLYDEMHFFTRAITAAEVLSLYQVKK